MRCRSGWRVASDEGQYVACCRRQRCRLGWQVDDKGQYVDIIASCRSGWQVASDEGQYTDAGSRVVDLDGELLLVIAGGVIGSDGELQVTRDNVLLLVVAGSHVVDSHGRLQCVASCLVGRHCRFGWLEGCNSCCRGRRCRSGLLSDQG